jgi:hypothetical protein
VYSGIVENYSNAQASADPAKASPFYSATELPGSVEYAGQNNVTLITTTNYKRAEEKK